MMYIEVRKSKKVLKSTCRIPRKVVNYFSRETKYKKYKNKIKRNSTKHYTRGFTHDYY